MLIEHLAEHFHARRMGPDQWLARCPTSHHQHGDRHPSLSIRRGASGRNLFHCHAFQCRPREIAQASGIPLRELLYECPSKSGVSYRHRPTPTITELALAIALAQRWVDALPVYETGDAIRHARRLVKAARDRASVLGDVPEVWEILALAAELETEATALDSEVSG